MTTACSPRSIPGSHDTMTYLFKEQFPAWVKCQSISLLDQLNLGIRFLDIRLRRFKNGFTLHHGKIWLGISLTSVLEIVSSFLKQHPSEAVLMNVQEEHVPHESTEEFIPILERYFSSWSAKDIIYRTSTAEIRLGEIRGKIVVMDNAPPGAEKYISWPHGRVSNNAAPRTYGGKWSGCKSNLLVLDMPCPFSI